MAFETKTGVKRFGGNGYSNWKFRLTMLLRSEEVHDALDSAKVSDTAIFRKKNNQCIHLICAALEDTHLSFARGCNFAFEIMKKLDDVYEKPDIISELNVLREWQSLKMKNGSDLNTHFCAFEEIVTKLRSVGGEPTDKQVIGQLLLFLPDEYAVTKEIIKNTRRLEYENIKQKLLSRFVELRADNGGKNGDEETAMVAVKGRNGDRSSNHVRTGNQHNGKAYRSSSNVNFKGRYRNGLNRNNVEFNRENNRSKSIMRCFNCNLIGHRAAECRKPKNLNRSVICKNCEGFGHTVVECKRRDAKNGRVNVIEQDEKKSGNFSFLVNSMESKINVGLTEK